MKVELKKMKEGRERDREKINKEIPIYKIEDERRIVYGVVLDPYIVDTQGDWSPPSEVEKTAHGWMENSQAIGLSHRKEADAVPVESFLMPYPSDEDYSRAMKNEPHKVYNFKFGSGFVHSGSWVLGTKINDDATWKLVKSGDLGSYSIGGHGARREINRSAVPEPTEVIEVDWSKDTLSKSEQVDTSMGPVAKELFQKADLIIEKSDGKLTQIQAFEKVLKADPELSERYRREVIVSTAVG